MTSTLWLLFLPRLISSYNFDASYFPYGYGSRGSLGYSVSLYSEKLNSSADSKSWLFVGDPTYKSGNETGSLFYTSQLLANWVRLNPHGILTTTVNGSSSKSLTRGWYGAAMDISQKDGSITACAPRTTFTFWSDGKVVDETLQGVCYSGSVHSPSLEVKDFFTYKKHNNPMTGFAVHYPQRQIGLDSVFPIIGSPMHENVGAVHTLDDRNWTTLEKYSGNYLPLFGYAISSGYYFNESQLMIAGGAPGWNHVGQVAIMKYYQDISMPFIIIHKINGTELGEYFGASLTTGDLNNDGLDDLIVGAPHWSNDNGRVYIYLGNKEGFSEAAIKLEGSMNDALYGYALTSGDFDDDGFDDLVVTAPWHDFGVIYIYYGDDNLGVDTTMKLGQEIAVEDGERFGYSLSNPVDVDDNGFSDIAVGASGSVTAGMIRSKAVIKIEITLVTVPLILSKNSTSFVIKFCVRNDVSRRFDGAMFFRLDEAFNRTTRAVYKYIILERSSLQYCGSKTVYLKNNHNLFVDIEIFAEYQFNIPDSECQKLVAWNNQMCPVKYKNRNPFNRTKISFGLDCEGERTCQASIIAKLEFKGISNSTYTIGSNDFNLLLMITNDGEPAYSTSVIFYIPKGFFFNLLEPSCHKKDNQQSMIVKCDVGDPLTKHMKKYISLNFSMSGLDNFPLEETTLNFTANIVTRSANQGQSNVTIPLKLKADASILLTGKDYNKVRYFGSNDKPFTLNFHHNYQISQFGVTPISKVLLKVLVPRKLGCLQFLKIAKKPRVSLSDRFYECSMGDVSVSKRAIGADKLSTKNTRPNQMESLQSFGKNSRTTHIKKADANANQLQCENIESQHVIQLNSRNSDVINLNCSAPNIICEQVECEISFPNIAYGISKLPVHLNIEFSELIDHTEERNIAIHFTTEAIVHVLNPITKFNIPGAGIPFPLTTIFNFSPNPIHRHSIFKTIPTGMETLNDEVGIPLILGSILLGFLLLGILVVVLRHLGFFERKKKKAMKVEEIEMRSPAQ